MPPKQPKHECAIPSNPNPPHQTWDCPSCGRHYWSDGRQWWKWPDKV